MKKIIIIKNCNEDNLKLHRVNYTSDLLDILFDNIIKELSLEKLPQSKENTSTNKTYDYLEKEKSNRKLLDIINNQRYDSIMELALRDIAKNIDNDYLGHIKDCKEVWCLTGKYYIPRQVTNSEDLYTKCSLFRTKEDAEKGREHLLDYAKILSTM